MVVVVAGIAWIPIMQRIGGGQLYGYLQKADIVAPVNVGLVWGPMTVFYCIGYLVAAICFILGLKRLNSPATALHFSARATSSSESPSPSHPVVWSPASMPPICTAGSGVEALNQLTRGGFDLVLSYTGGRALDVLRRDFGAFRQQFE